MALTLNVALQVGATATTVEVTASAGADLQVLNATVGSTISGDSLMLLPNLGRDASALATLQVGVAPGGQVAGTQADQSAFQLDGGNNSDDMAGNYSAYTTSNGGGPSGVVPTPVESVEEFKVGITNQTADFNGAAGSQVQMVTKRGSNQFHGALYDYYFATNVGAANSWKNNHTASGSLLYTPLPTTHRNRFGGALGGPVLPKLLGGKTYFFVNLEGYRFPNATTVERTVPTALMRAGVVQVPNSAGVYQAYNLNPNPVTVNGVTYQPAACGGGSCDPRGIGLNPIVNQIWSKYMPLPNDPQAGDQFNTQGYRSNLKLPQSSDFGVLRLDHDFGSRNHFMASDRYYRYSQKRRAHHRVHGRQFTARERDGGERRGRQRQRVEGRLGAEHVRRSKRDLWRVPQADSRPRWLRRRRRSDSRIRHLEPGCHGLERHPRLRALRRHDHHSGEQRAEPLSAVEPVHEHRQPADVGRDYRTGQYAAADAVRTAASLLRQFST